nr:hypothetical protein [Tanacetum cinerariifolium]
MLGSDFDFLKDDFEDELDRVLMKELDREVEEFAQRMNSIWPKSVGDHRVILNGDSLTPTKVVDGIVKPFVPTTAEQRLAKKNELKARETFLMALPDKHQL